MPSRGMVRPGDTMATQAGPTRSAAGNSVGAIAPCPRCEQPMDPGVLGAESLVGGAKWMRGRSRLSLGGEGLVSPDAWGNVYFDGYRCRQCRLLILGY